MVQSNLMTDAKKAHDWNECEYPIIGMTATETIVLFNKPKCGTVIKVGCGACVAIGEYAMDFCMEAFTPLPLDKEVLLKNE